MLYGLSHFLNAYIKLKTLILKTIPSRNVVVKGVRISPLEIYTTCRVPVHVKVLQGESVSVVVNGGHQLPGDETALILVTRVYRGKQLTRGEEPGPRRRS